MQLSRQSPTIDNSVIGTGSTALNITIATLPPSSNKPNHELRIAPIVGEHGTVRSMLKV